MKRFRVGAGGVGGEKSGSEIALQTDTKTKYREADNQREEHSSCDFV